MIQLSSHQLLRIHYSPYHQCCIVSLLTALLNYQLKKRYVTAAMTVAIMHLPQEIAYAVLGQVILICGMYGIRFCNSMFSLSNLKHVSAGIFAAVCLMTGEIIDTNVKNRMTGISNYNDTDIGSRCDTYG
jgi:solute carrier family 26 protein